MIKTMVGCKDALEWLRKLPVKPEEEIMKERVINRAEYEFLKDKPVAPKFHKGVYGKKYDSYTCGQCGFVISCHDNWCPNCGFRIADNYLGRRKTAEEQGDHY